MKFAKARHSVMTQVIYTVSPNSGQLNPTEPTMPHPSHHPLTPANNPPELAAAPARVPDAQAIDETIRQAGSHAAKLLWMAALSSEAVVFDLLQDVWNADVKASTEVQELKALLDTLANLPPDLAKERQAIVQSLSPTVLAQLEKLATHTPSAAPPLPTLLADLVSAGLLLETRKPRPVEYPAPDTDGTIEADDMVAFACPPAVRARSLALAGADFDAAPICLAYARHENIACHMAKNTDLPAAIAAASRALAHYMQAKDYPAIARFLAIFDTTRQADKLVAESLLPQLQAVPQDKKPPTLEARIAAANAAKHAAFAQRDWAGALPHIDTMLQLKPQLQPPADATDMGVDHFNRAMALMQLERLDQARSELEICLGIFQAEADMLGKVHGQLASLLAMQGDFAQAISHQRTGLALIEGAGNQPSAGQTDAQAGCLPDPRDRVISHNNLANYLSHTNMASDYIEASYHQIAVIAYSLCVPREQQAQRRKWALGVLKSRIDSKHPLLPPLAEVLAQAAFQALARWLQQWLAENQSDMAQLQAMLDDIAAQVVQAKG
jgi:tetratricopeptide (TPR) repeat protein